MSLTTLKRQRCFEGIHGSYRHESATTGCTMHFSVYEPPATTRGKVPVLYFLSGLTCTDENFSVKSGAQQYAARHGLMLVIPDTSPRGVGLPGEDDDFDFGTGASFYLDATREPWSQHYRMYSYITHELPSLIASDFPADTGRQGIFGHSMGGHGAIVCAVKNPVQYRSVSAFAPISAPSDCPWGKKAFAGYLGANPAAWAAYDSSQLIRSQGYSHGILVDQGTDDPFLEEQLQPEKLREACKAAQVPLELNMRQGYDHSYFFIASFVENHVAYHARALQQ